jgi:hypothetical protein
MVTLNGYQHTMNDIKGTETPQAIERIGHSGWERLILGENGISGTVRMLVYIVLFALVFGTLFYFAR